jgi:hypothetical protein
MGGSCRAARLPAGVLPEAGPRCRDRRGVDAATALRPCGHLRREAAARQGGGPCRIVQEAAESPGRRPRRRRDGGQPRMDGGKTGTRVGVPGSDAKCQFSLAEMPHDPCCPKCLKDLVRDMLTNMSWRARGGGGTVLPFRFHFCGGFFGSDLPPIHVPAAIRVGLASPRRAGGAKLMRSVAQPARRAAANAA